MTPPFRMKIDSRQPFSEEEKILLWNMLPSSLFDTEEELRKHRVIHISTSSVRLFSHIIVS
jgi:hypothetical protein